MGSTTTNLALPYPTATDAPDGPGAILALAKAIDTLFASGTVGFPGSVTADSAGTTAVRRFGNSVSLNLHINVGASGANTTTASLVASTSIGPMAVVRFPLFLYAGGFLLAEWRTNGAVNIVSGSAAANTTLFGSIVTAA